MVEEIFRSSPTLRRVPVIPLVELFSGVSVEDICLAASGSSTCVQSYLRTMTADSVSHSMPGALSEGTSSGDAS